MMWPRVLAQSKVDVGHFAAPVDMIPFLVTCWGELYGGDELPSRVYEIAAVSDDIAGRAGLDLYVSEMERNN